MLKIFGIGTDIVAVSRIQENLTKHKEKFIQRILSDKEQENLPNEIHLATYLAKRFAGKEAFAKALGTGIANGLAFNQISILNDERGQPFVECSGKALELISQKQIQDIKISLSDEKEFALAFVILIINNERSE